MHTTMAAVLIFVLSILMALPVSIYGGLPPADLNCDGDVDGEDLSDFASSCETEVLARFATSFGQVEKFSNVYEVGPGNTYADPDDVPWESLAPGAIVRIHFTEEPYANKWVLAVAGTSDAPIVVRGIPQNGLLPVITGENATTRKKLDYWNENRSVIKVGGSSRPSAIPSYVIIENLDIRSARPAYTFTDDSVNGQTYSSNAASIHVEGGWLERT